MTYNFSVLEEPKKVHIETTLGPVETIKLVSRATGVGLIEAKRLLESNFQTCANIPISELGKFIRALNEHLRT